VLGAVLGASLAFSPAGGQEASAWRRCREGADSLRSYRSTLVARAEGLAAARRAAADGGRGGEERRLLRRIEALAESIQVVSGDLADRDRVCREAAAALLRIIDAELERGAAPERIDSLLSVRESVGPQPVAGFGTEFDLPLVSLEDPPTLLRQVADHARDLADRADRWRSLVAWERTQLDDRIRLQREVRELLDDQRFLDEGGDLGMFSETGDEGDWTEWQAGQTGILMSVLAPEIPELEGAPPLEAIERIEAFLALRSRELRVRATELDAEADRREREP